MFIPLNRAITSKWNLIYGSLLHAGLKIPYFFNFPCNEIFSQQCHCECHFVSWTRRWECLMSSESRPLCPLWLSHRPSPRCEWITSASESECSAQLACEQHQHDSVNFTFNIVVWSLFPPMSWNHGRKLFTQGWLNHDCCIVEQRTLPIRSTPCSSQFSRYSIDSSPHTFLCCHCCTPLLTHLPLMSPHQEDVWV